ncbi:MAG: sulfatase-like hydrolase/transferase [Chitinivibrionales bacterium]|nr:sulfatase-like hydrolase/transferase [Chitinivibrionales bacterium]
MTQRPNIIIVTSDQQRKDTLGCYGARYADTPNLDRLAENGIVCERAYCTNPVCSPSRVSLFTGQSVGRHGCWNIGVNTPQDTVTIAHRLRNAGYRSHYIGKIHFQAWHSPPEHSREHCWHIVPGSKPNPRPPQPLFSGPYYGFETIEWASGHTRMGLTGHYGEWVRGQVDEQQFASFARLHKITGASFGAEACDWDLPHHLHNSVWTADRTIEFLQRHDASQPFLLAVGFQDPHHPHALPKDFANRVTPDQTPIPSFQKGELLDKPPHFAQAQKGEYCYQGEDDTTIDNRLMGQLNGFDYSSVSIDDARLSRSYYYSMVNLMDEQLGRIFACLDKQGLAGNTIIIFTTDHGELLGDHGLWLKGPFHYEQLINVPLIIRWPDAKAKRVNSLVSLADIAPTLLRRSGVAFGDRELDGVSQLPVIRGDADSVRRSLLVECVDNERDLRLKTIVTKDRKLTWYHGRKYGELYHLDTDPNEITNLWDEPDCCAERAQLLSELLGNLECLEFDRRGSRMGPA